MIELDPRNSQYMMELPMIASAQVSLVVLSKTLAGIFIDDTLINTVAIDSDNNDFFVGESLAQLDDSLKSELVRYRMEQLEELKK